MIGKTLAHYEILQKLGSGGMGDVYRARDTKLGREVAIKVLPEEFSRDTERRMRFTREAQAIAALKHPNIVTIHSVEESGDVNYLTMELVEGDTLAARIPSGGVTLEEFFEFSVPLTDALSSAHEQGITHRDLKPANVMFDRDGRLKVLDFGLAKLLESGPDVETAKTVVQSSDTAVGQIMGTAAYMSPEQAEGKRIDHRSDIFSLGIMLYEMATGERPFKGDTQISTISSILKDQPRHISEVRREIPRHVGRIVNRCLEKKADRRFQSAKDVRNDLESLKKEIDSGQLSADMESAVSMSGPKKPMNWKPLAITGAVAVVLAVATIFLLRQSDGEGVTATVTTPAPIATPSPPTSGNERKMAVVLPFENLGPPEDAYFAAGMTDEITSRLATVSGLGVISRTSATQYDRTGKTIREIGDDLGVDYVLEGSVRWAKNPDGSGRVRITPQLIEVANDAQLWSQTYDREIDDIFEVQTDIATRVIDQLDVTLKGSERELMAQAPTENMEAYKVFMQAKDYRSADFTIYDREYTAMLEKATELDPNFIDAWAALTTHHAITYHGPLDRTEERLSRARDALQKAEAIDPNHYRTRLARGSYLYYGFRDYDRALEEFLAAADMVPNDADARGYVGYIYRRQGKLAECAENLKHAFELDPRSDTIARNLGATYRAMRDFPSAIKYFDIGLELDPGNFEIRWNKAAAMVDWKGDVEAAREIMTAEYTEGDNWYHFGWAFMYFGLQDCERAKAEMDRMDDSQPFIHVAKLHLGSLCEALTSGPDDVREQLEETNRALTGLLEHAPSNAAFRQYLAENLALLGRHDAAVREAKLAVDLEAKDQFVAPAALFTLAEIYAHIGRHEEAIDLIERLLKMEYQSALTPYGLERQMWFKPLRDNPRYMALLPRNI